MRNKTRRKGGDSKRRESGNLIQVMTVAILDLSACGLCYPFGREKLFLAETVARHPVQD